jgi:uracil permease
MTKAKGFLKVIPFLIGILSGYVLAVILGMVDFTAVKEAGFFAMPEFVLPFIDYKISFGALLTIAPIALVTICEHIGDHKSLSNIIGKDLINDPGLDRTLLGDGVATLVGGLLGGPANTTYGENTSVVGMSKVASVKVIGLAAIIAIVVGFFGKFTALVSTIPSAVLGGVSLLLYGFIAVNGLKVLISNRVNFDDSKNVIVASSMLVLGLGGAVIAFANGDMSITISGMTLASIVGIILNLVLPSDVIEEGCSCGCGCDESCDCGCQEGHECHCHDEELDEEVEDALDKLKDDIKEELTITLKKEIVDEIKKELDKDTKKKSTK